MNTTLPVTQSISINDTSLVIKEYNGQRVVTFDNIDMVHKRSSGTAKKRFNDNKDKFIENVDYYCLEGVELANIKLRMNFIHGRTSKLYLITQTGYLMLVKSFTDDLAWKVQRELVNSYFSKPVLPQSSLYNPNRMVVDIPVNEKHQRLISSLKAYTDALNILLNELNRYNSEKEAEALKTSINVLASSIHAKAMVLSTEKYNIIKEPY